MKTNFNIGSLTPSNLRKAATLAESIERQQNELTALLSGNTVTFSARRPTKSVSKGNRKGRVLTDEQRARISEGLRQKWAERKNSKSPAVPVASVQPSTSTVAA